jgi:hypothetical protein
MTNRFAPRSDDEQLSIGESRVATVLPQNRPIAAC